MDHDFNRNLNKDCLLPYDLNNFLNYPIDIDNIVFLQILTSHIFSREFPAKGKLSILKQTFLFLFLFDEFPSSYLGDAWTLGIHVPFVIDSSVIIGVQLELEVICEVLGGWGKH